MIPKIIPRILLALFTLFLMFGLSACDFSQRPNSSKAIVPASAPAVDSRGPEASKWVPSADSKYIPYSESAYNESSGKKRVLFFHAPWCPYCKAADKVFNANLDRIPVDVALFKTDYDTEKALKTKYGVTYQHTFVYVDADGNPLKTWNGGDIEELITNTK